MNYNEEIASMFKEFGLEINIEKVPPHRKPTPQSYLELEKSIALKCAENDRMRMLSEVYSRNSLPIL